MRLIVLFGTALLLLAPVWARAEENEPVGYREAIDEALNELSLRNYEEAHALFARANSLYPNARTHRGLGFVEFELRNYVQCVRELEAALRSDVKPLTGSLRADTEHLVERARNFVARVRVEARPGATQLIVDGVPVATTEELLLNPGKHTLEVHGLNSSPETRQLRVRPGEAQTVTILFRTLEHAEVERPLRRNPWLWTSVGVVAAGAAAVGTYFALRSEPTRTEPGFGGSAGARLNGPP